MKRIDHRKNTNQDYIGLIETKPVFNVSDQVNLKHYKAAQLQRLNRKIEFSLVASLDKLLSNK